MSRSPAATDFIGSSSDSPYVVRSLQRSSSTSNDNGSAYSKSLSEGYVSLARATLPTSETAFKELAVERFLKRKEDGFVGAGLVGGEATFSDVVGDTPALRRK